MIDIERLISDHLRQRAAVQAFGARVVSKTPEDTDSAPWVRVTRLDAPQSDVDPSDHLVGYYLQLDCYATNRGGHPQAVDLGIAVRTALTEMTGTFPQGIVSGARIEGDSRVPDLTLEPARERVIITTTVWAHG